MAAMLRLPPAGVGTAPSDFPRRARFRLALARAERKPQQFAIELWPGCGRPAMSTTTCRTEGYPCNGCTVGHATE